MIRVLPYLLVLSVFFLIRCAQQTPLSGGERDNDAPILDSTKAVVPANGTINFSATRIVIPFNEFVTLKDKEKQILITPFLDTKPDIYTKGKKVIIDFKAPLENNTTYIINFGNSIVDLTEGNEVVNYKYVFSTGSFIDSLKYNAVVYDSYTKKPVSGAFVMLYKAKEDSVIFKEKPNYFGITDANGRCYIENIAVGDYKVVSFMEENSDYKWNSKDEKIGFTERIFHSASDTIIDTLILFNNLPEKLEISEVKILSNGSGWIRFNQPLENNLAVLSDSLVYTFAEDGYTKLSPTRDTLSFYCRSTLTSGENYSIGVSSIGARKMQIPSNEDTSITFKTNALSGIKPYENLRFAFNQPIKASDVDKINLSKGKSPVPFEAIISENVITIAADWQMGENYEVNLLPGAIISYKDISNDTISAFFETLEENDFGQLHTHINVSGGQYIVELIKNDKIVYRDFPNGSDFSRSYAYLEPGDYQLRLIFDTNNNDNWDTGDYFQHIQPERVEYYSDPIKIKKGWDMEINWVIQ